MLKTGWELTDAEIAERYQAVAGRRRYDLVQAHGLILGLAHRCVQSGILPAGGTRVADLGCGTGVLMESMCRAFPSWSIMGIDPSHPPGAGQRQLVERGTIWHGSAYEVRADDGSYDLIVMCEVLEHLNRPDAALREVRRLLRPGGVAIVTVPNASAFVGWKHWERIVPFEALYRRLLPAEHPKMTWQPIDTLYEYDEIMALFDRNGWDVVDSDGGEYLKPILAGAPIFRRLYAKLNMDRLAKKIIPERFAYRLALVLTRKPVSAPDSDAAI